MEQSASEQELVETYKAMRAIVVDSLNAAHRSLEFVNKLAPAVCRLNLSEYIPLQPGGDISVGLEYKRLRVPTFLLPQLVLAHGFNARPCAAGFEIVQARTDHVACVLNTSKPLFEVTLEAFLTSNARMQESIAQRPDHRLNQRAEDHLKEPRELSESVHSKPGVKQHKPKRQTPLFV